MSGTLLHRGLIRGFKGLAGIRKLYDTYILRSPNFDQVWLRQVDLASGREARGFDGLGKHRSVCSLAFPIFSSSPPVLRQNTRTDVQGPNER